MLNFFLGMIFIYILLPILESAMGVICSFLEILKAKCSFKIAEYNDKISQIGLNREEPNTNPIGFHYTSKEEDEIKYEEDD